MSGHIVPHKGQRIFELSLYTCDLRFFLRVTYCVIYEILEGLYSVEKCENEFSGIVNFHVF